MPVIYQKWIYRADLAANPDALYLFGDNFARKGLGGQAAECWGMPNAVGLATKHRPTNEESAFLGDGDRDCFLAEIARAKRVLIPHLEKGGVVVIPADGLGTGRGGLPERAPMLYQDVLRFIALLARVKCVRSSTSGLAPF